MIRDYEVTIALTIIVALLLTAGGLFGAALATGRPAYWIAAVVLFVTEIVGFVGYAKGWWF